MMSVCAFLFPDVISAKQWLVLESSQQMNQLIFAALIYIVNIVYENNNKNKRNIAMNSL